MSFFKKAAGAATGAVKDVVRGAEHAGEGFLGGITHPDTEAATGYLRGIRNIIDPRNLPYFLNLSKRATFTPGVDLSTITTDDQARNAIDRIIGVDDEARKQAEAIAYYRDQGGLARSVSLIQTGFGTSPTEYSFRDPTAELIAGFPFTPEGDARLATRNFAYDPIYVANQELADQLNDPQVFQQYMRLTRPQELLPHLVERDQRKGGGMSSWNDAMHNIAGHPLGSLWHMTTALFSGKTTGRIEEALGMGIYQNAIPDPYLRDVIARKSYALNVYGLYWDPSHSHERSALAMAEDISAKGLTGPAAAEAMSTFFQEHPLGFAGSMLNILGQATVDPMWVLPIGKIGEVATMPLKGITEGAPLTRFFRLGTPAGRDIILAGGKAAGEGKFTEQAFRNLFNLEGYKVLTRLPEASYAAQRWAEPAKGPMRLLFSQPANLYAESVRGKLGLRLDAIAERLVAEPERITDISETFKTLKPTAWVEQNMPGLLNDPTIADFAARVSGQKSEIFDRALTKIQDRIAEWTDAGLLRPGLSAAEETKLMAAGESFITHDALKTAISEYVAEAAHSFASNTQQALWDASAFGRVLNRYWFPWSAAIKSVTARFTLSSPGFVWLQIPSNLIRLMVDSSGHPLQAFNDFSRSFWLEGSTIKAASEAGTAIHYPESYTRMANAVGLTPLDVERRVTRVTGVHDLLGRSLMDADAAMLSDNLSLMQKALISPAKEVGQRARILDKIFFPLQAANRMDKVTRRAAFFGNLRKQVHLAFAPGGEFRAGLAPVRDLLVAAGAKGPDIDRIENALAGELKLYALGEKPLPEGFKSIDQGVVAHAINQMLGDMEAGKASALLSAHDYARRFARDVLGHVDKKAEVFATQDLAHVMDYIHTDILPLLDEAQQAGTPEAFTAAMKKINRMMETKALEYDVPADIGRQLARLPTTIRGKTTYAGALRITDDALRADAIDTVSLLDRLLGVTKGEAWASKRQSVWGLARGWQKVAEEAVPENFARLRAIRQVYDDLARSGLEEVVSNTPVSAKAFAKLPEDLTVGSKDGALSVGQLWKNYFKRRDDTVSAMFSFVRDEISKVSDAHAGLVDKLQAVIKKQQVAHRKAVADALAAGTDDAWQAAGEQVRLLFEQGATKKAASLGLPVTDMPKAYDLMDHNAVLARTVHEFKDYFMTSLRQDIPKLLSGELKVEDNAIQTARKAAQAAQDNWPGLRDTMLGNARMGTDFTMLNYLEQRGLDRVIQGVIPFEFWPTRDALHWLIRGARNPGAFSALAIAMFESQDMAKQYGYPQRLQNRIPIPMPGLGEFLDKMPGIGSLIEGGDFAPIYFIDPVRFIFPMTFLRDQIDDPARRNTPLGRVADFMQNNTPFNIGPFQMFAFKQAGLLDRDAWHSTQLNGGPFGIPLTPLARATARFVFTGDTEAIPKDQQDMYATTGHFGPSWLRDLLGLDNTQFDDYRAERALASLVATGELIPGASKEEQLQKAWIAMDAHKGPEWKRAVQSSHSETNLRQLTSWIGFPFGDIVGVNEGEMIWFGLKGLYGEASRQGKLDEFFKKYPEFELRSAAVKGLDNPEERQKAVDTELYYQGVDQYVNAPFEQAVADLDGQQLRLQQMDQTPEVRDQLAIIEAEQRSIKDEQQKRRDTLDRAFPFREDEPSINRDPRERALSDIRSQWYDLQREDGETTDAFDFRREQFLQQFPSTPDAAQYENTWQELTVQFMLTRIQASQDTEHAYQSDDFDKVTKIKDQRDAMLTAIHEQAAKMISRQDVELYLASFMWPKSQAQQEFEQADALKDLWFTLTGSGSPFTGREKGAISAYFRSLPVMQHYFPVETLDLADLSLAQRMALMQRKNFWKNYYSIQSSATQLDYARQMKPVLDQANELLGMPPLQLVDVASYPQESSGDPLISHIQMAASIGRSQAIASDQQLTDAQKTELENLLASLGIDTQDPSMTSEDISRLLSPYSMPDPEQ